MRDCSTEPIPIMNKGPKSNDALLLVLQLLYLAFFTGLVFAFHFLSSLSIGLILITGIVINKIEHKPILHPNTKNFFLFACISFYILQFISLLYTHNTHETWVHLRVKSELIFVPLTLSCSDHITGTSRKKLMSLLCIVLFIASLYCLAINTLNYIQHHDSSVFFYHALVSPLHQHAVLFSIYVFIILLYLIETAGKKDTAATGFILRRKFHIFLILYFSILLLFLSSKLVIFFYLLYIFHYAVKIFLKQKTKRATAVMLLLSGLLAAIFLVTTRNPVSNRFTQILNTDMNLVKQDKYDPGIYFNGVEFRLIQWKFVNEILNENHCWWTGISPGDAQNFLDKKYIEKNMYIGDPARGDHGYLRYNTHDQILESLLQSGIAGVLLFLLILFALIRLAWKKKNLLLGFTVALLIAFSLIESVLETQYALLLFTFFPLFLDNYEKGEES